MRQKKKRIMAVIIVAAALLIGWKVKPVELIDDKLLIDLDTVIVEPDWGQEGNPGDTSDKPTPEEGEDIIISIRGEEILLNGEVVKDTSVLHSYLSKQVKAQGVIILEDNYAEAHVYKDVYNLLEMLQTVKQFKLNEIAR